MFKYFIIIFFFLSLDLNAKESLLTLKQQLDRLQREVNDLSKSVFKSSRDENRNNQSTQQPSDLTAFDLRIYDLEKDIKKMNENYEEIIFQIDDLKILLEKLSFNISERNKKETNVEDVILDEDLIISADNIEKKDINTLGTLVINSKDLSTNQDKEIIIDDEINLEKAEKIEVTKKLTPEEEFQIAFDMIRNQEFSDAKLALQNYIEKYKDEKLVGSAHYWLGEIFLLKKEYREAALVFAEGYQKFPDSFKAPDMLYKLSFSLFKIEKNKDACNTIDKLSLDFPKHKLLSKAQNQKLFDECFISAE